MRRIGIVRSKPSRSPRKLHLEPHRHTLAHATAHSGRFVSPSRLHPRYETEVGRASHGARPPGLVLVGEPDELGLESAHPQLALRARLVELPEAHGHVTADDDRTPARLDDDHLQPARVAR